MTKNWAAPEMGAPGWAGGSQIRGVRVLGLGIPTLDHEVLDDPVKAGPVVVALSSQLLEVVHGLGRILVPELGDHLPFRSLEYLDFIRRRFRLGGRGLGRSGSLVSR